MGIGLDFGSLLNGIASEAASIRTERHQQENDNFMQMQSILQGLISDETVPDSTKSQAYQAIMDMSMEHMGYSKKSKQTNPVRKAIEGLVGQPANDFSGQMAQVGVGSGNAKTSVGGLPPQEGTGQPPAPPMLGGEPVDPFHYTGNQMAVRKGEQAATTDITQKRALWAEIANSAEGKAMAKANPRLAQDLFFKVMGGAMPQGSINLKTDTKPQPLEWIEKTEPEMAGMVAQLRQMGVTKVFAQRDPATGAVNNLIPYDPVSTGNVTKSAPMLWDDLVNRYPQFGSLPKPATGWGVLTYLAGESTPEDAIPGAGPYAYVDKVNKGIRLERDSEGNIIAIPYESQTGPVLGGPPTSPLSAAPTAKPATSAPPAPPTALGGGVSKSLPPQTPSTNLSEAATAKPTPGYRIVKEAVPTQAIQLRVKQAQGAADLMTKRITDVAKYADIVDKYWYVIGPVLTQAESGLGRTAQGVFQTLAIPEEDRQAVNNYVNSLRNLREDIFSIRQFLGNSPVRSDSQVAIMLGQIPDETTNTSASVKDRIRSFQDTLDALKRTIPKIREGNAFYWGEDKQPYVFLDLQSELASSQQGATPKIGDRKTFPNGNIGEWDGMGWKQVPK